MFKVYDSIRIIILMCILFFFSIQAYSNVVGIKLNKPKNILKTSPIYNQSTNDLSFNLNPKEYLGAEFINILIYEISSHDLKLISNNRCRNIATFQFDLHNAGNNLNPDFIYKIEWKYTIPFKNINTTTYLQNVTY